MNDVDRARGTLALVLRLVFTVFSLAFIGVVMTILVRGMTRSGDEGSSGSSTAALILVAVISLALAAASLSWVPRALRAWIRGEFSAYLARESTGVPQPDAPPPPPTWRGRASAARPRPPTMFLPDGSVHVADAAVEPVRAAAPAAPGRTRLLGKRQVVGALLFEAVPAIWLTFAIITPQVATNGSLTVMRRTYAPGEVPGWSVETLGFLAIGLVLQLATLPAVAMLLGVVGAVWGEPTADGVVLTRRSPLTWRVSTVVVRRGSELRVERAGWNGPHADSSITLVGDAGRIKAWLQGPYMAADHDRLRDWCAAYGVLLYPERAGDASPR